MNRSELINALAFETRGHPDDVARMLDALSAVVGRALYFGKPVTIPGIGRIETHRAPPREYRNPRNGKLVKVNARVRPRFRATKALCERLSTEDTPSGDLA